MVSMNIENEQKNNSNAASNEISIADIRDYPSRNPIIQNVIFAEDRYFPSTIFAVPSRESTLERIERKLDELKMEVATRDDIIQQTNILLEHQKKSYENLLEKWKYLRGMQSDNVSHKRLQRYSSAFLAFFALSFVSQTFLQITIVTPFWNNVGLLLSVGFLIMSWMLGKDWKEINPTN